MFLAPDLEVVARKPDGVVEIRFNGSDGSQLTASILVSPRLVAAPRLQPRSSRFSRRIKHC